MPREQRYYFPVTGGRYSDTWGAARSQGRRHEGTDIFAPRGTPIQAMIGGRVVKSFWNDLGGITVRVMGSDGLYYYYTHMEKVAAGLKIGQMVHSGQLLGYVGNTGNARGTPTHLHIGIYRGNGGPAFNPYNMLRTAMEAPKPGVGAEPPPSTTASQGQARSASGGGDGAGPSAPWTRAIFNLGGNVAGGGASGSLRITDPSVRLSAGELAEQYGWAAGLLNSDPELKKLFSAAVKGQWTPERFTAKLRGTRWYRSRSEAARTYDALRSTDPGQFKTLNDQAIAQVQDLAGQMGAVVSGRQTQAIASQMARLGLTEAQVRNALAGYVSYSKQYGGFLGEAGQHEDAIREVAYRNGVRISDASLGSWVKSIANGNHTAEDYQKWIRTQAASAFPGLADQLNAGMDLADIASPYVETMGNILEINPQDVNLFDPTIRRALSAKGADGKPAVKSIWEFEQDLRKDHRWVQTNNARESILDAGHQVLKDFGFSG